MHFVCVGNCQRTNSIEVKQCKRKVSPAPDPTVYTLCCPKEPQSLDYLAPTTDLPSQPTSQQRIIVSFRQVLCGWEQPRWR